MLTRHYLALVGGIILAAISSTFGGPCPNKCAVHEPSETAQCEQGSVSVGCGWAYSPPGGGETEYCNAVKECMECAVDIPAKLQSCAEAATVPCDCCVDTVRRADCKPPACHGSGPCNNPVLSCSYSGLGTCGEEPYTYLTGSCSQCTGATNCEFCG